MKLIIQNFVYQEAVSGTYKILGDSLRNKPENRLPSDYLEPEIFLKKALTGRFAMVDVKTIIHTDDTKIT